MQRRASRWTAARRAVPWRALFAEYAGTALLVALGLSLVIVDFAPRGPMAALLGPGARRALTGFLFGSVGASITVSALGKASGAHLNPAVTLAFVLHGKMRRSLGGAYVVAQAAGAVSGASALLAWGPTGSSVDYGATLPGASYGTWWALAGESATTFALVLLLLVVLGSRRLRRFTPALLPPLYAVMVFLEAPVSGTSTNPARSLGPAVVAGAWHGWWVYWAGPGIGCLLAVLVFRSPWLSQLEIGVARVYHFAEAEMEELGADAGLTGTR